MYSCVNTSGSVMALKRSTLLCLVSDPVVLQFVDHVLVLFPVCVCSSGSLSVCAAVCCVVDVMEGWLLCSWGQIALLRRPLRHGGVVVGCYGEHASVSSRTFSVSPCQSSASLPSPPGDSSGSEPVHSHSDGIFLWLGLVTGQPL